MAKNKKATLDLTKGLSILEKRGMKQSLRSLAMNNGTTAQLAAHWNGSSPYILHVINRTMKATGIGFPDLMKEIQNEETPAILTFILDVCNDTGLTFEEIVKEV